MNQETQDSSSVQSLLTPTAERHGPAFTQMYNELYKPSFRYLSFSSMDTVVCVRCLIWPTQASNWPKRNRDHGWPEARTINLIVNTGCDVVQAVHPRCKQQEGMCKYQWRLSFSRAEVTLLNSWTPVQQIIYHMLRFVMKREVFAETNDSDQDAPKLSNYHIKTLMLWECEQKPQSWWSAESSLVKLCSSLLHKLSGCVANKRCQHYFINNGNLLDHFKQNASLAIRKVLDTLSDESVLLSWFIENYIRRCAECCPAEVSILFHDIYSCDSLKRVVDAVVDWKLSTLAKELYTAHYKSEGMIQSTTLLFRRDAYGIPILMKELQTFDPRLRDYFVALTSLRVAHTISAHSLTVDLLEILWTLFDLCSATVDDMDNNGALLSVMKAIKLARLQNVCCNALEMLFQEISQAYLHHSLACGQESTQGVVHVLLATLYYKSGHYQAAVDHCQQALNRRGHHRSQSRISTTD